MTEPRQRRRYTKRQKATAVIAAEVSSVAAASEQTGIPVRTIGYWVDDPRFAELRLKTREDLATEMTLLARMAAARILEKLPEFEPRDLVILLGVATDKGQLLSGQATSRAEHRELLADFDDHEREAMSDWLRSVARERLTADVDG